MLLRYLDKLESMPHPYAPMAAALPGGEEAGEDETAVTNGSGASP
jgi:hypothetical protein